MKKIKNIKKDLKVEESLDAKKYPKNTGLCSYCEVRKATIRSNKGGRFCCLACQTKAGE